MGEFFITNNTSILIMLASFFPANYKLLYIVPIVYVFTLIYANNFQIRNLQTESELGNHRVLLTVTATFTYHRQLRWIWLFLSLFTTVIYCGVAPRMFKQFFLNDKDYLNSVKFHKNIKEPEQHQPINKLVTFLNYSQVGWTLSLCGVVFLIDGTFPARESDIQDYIWSIHFVMLFGMLISLAVNIFCFFKLLHFADPEYRKNKHSIFRKYILAAGHFLSVINMMIFGGIVKISGSLSWDFVCIFEYLVVLFEILFVIDEWSGMVGSDSIKLRQNSDNELIDFRSKSSSNASDKSTVSETVVLIHSDEPKRIFKKKKTICRSRSAFVGTGLVSNFKPKTLSTLSRTISETVNKFD